MAELITGGSLLLHFCIVGLTLCTLYHGVSLSQQLAVTLFTRSLHTICSMAGSHSYFAYGQKAITAGSKRTY